MSESSEAWWEVERGGDVERRALVGDVNVGVGQLEAFDGNGGFVVTSERSSSSEASSVSES